MPFNGVNTSGCCEETNEIVGYNAEISEINSTIASFRTYSLIIRDEGYVMFAGTELTFC